jgi:hypothetical protein
VDEPEEDAEGRGLAGAVRSQEARHPPGGNGEAEVVDGEDGTVPLGEPFDDDRFHGCSVTGSASRVVTQVDRSRVHLPE